MKLLLMAYECSPYRGSEWAVGWGRLLGAAKVAETHVVTSEENFAALGRAQAEGLMPANVSFYTPASDARLRALEQKPGMFAYNYRAYAHWQKLAFALIERLHARERFDLVHQITVCTFREPGYGWQLDVPFLWGPVGGTQNFPARYLPMLSPAEAMKESARSLGNWFALRKQRVRDAAQHATVVIAANAENQRDLSRALGRPVELLLETGLHEAGEPDRARFERRMADGRASRTPQPLRLLWTGDLHTRKALPVLLKALTCVPRDVPWQLDVVGDGPMRSQWRAQAEASGFGERVRFHGRLPLQEAVGQLASAEVFCFTSLRDTSGNVVLEALAAGVPVLCFNHQGAADMVNESSGIKLPVRSPHQGYRDWAGAIESLANDPRRLYALSRGASMQARNFLWSRNHDRINQLYERLIQEKATISSLAPANAGQEFFDAPFEVAHGSLQ